MKKTQFIDLFQNIKKTWVSFVAITMFIALGIAVYLGMGWSAKAFREKLDSAYEDYNLYDISAYFPYGLNEEAVEAVQGIDGVDSVGTSWVSYEFFKHGKKRFQAIIHTIGDEMNVPFDVEGKLPEKEGEVAIQKGFAKANGIKIGDKIKFTGDKDTTIKKLATLVNYDLGGGIEKLGGEIKKIGGGDCTFLSVNEFEVTALVSHPLYLEESAGNVGISYLNRKQVNCAMFVSPDSRNKKYDLNCSELHIRSRALGDGSCFDDKYKKNLDSLTLKVKEKLNEVAMKRCSEIREKLKSVSNGTQLKLADARKQLDAMRQNIGDMAASSDGEGAEEMQGMLDAAEKTYEENKKTSDDLLKNIEKFTDVSPFINSRAQLISYNSEQKISGIFGKMRISMASLFVIVGLFVCYSAISRIVSDQTRNIGTKKALGFSDGEITAGYLLYVAFALVLGCTFGILIGVYVVESVLNVALVDITVLKETVYAADVTESVLMCLFEVVFVLLVTWIACRKTLKKRANALLRGGGIPRGKKRFFEKWKAWEKLSLLGKTIVNNCFNDKKRVFATLIGIAGCTSLIVTSLTLNENVMKSYDSQFEESFHFDGIVKYNGDTEVREKIQKILGEEGIVYTPVYKNTLVVRSKDGESLATSELYVSMEPESFSKLVTLNPVLGGDASDGGALHGLWMNYSLANEKNYKIGDEINLTNMGGVGVNVAPDGYYANYLTSLASFVDKEKYAELFGEEPVPNAFLVALGGDGQTGGASGLTGKLKKIKGYESLSEYKKSAQSAFNLFSKVSKLTVLIYTALAIVLAALVLINLYIMFVDEKKRELIVLLINGYGIKDANRYIYLDTIVLTVVGVILGAALGSVIGNLSVSAFDGVNMYMRRGIVPFAVFAGMAGTGVFSFIACRIALRKIRGFQLTDINKE